MTQPFPLKEQLKALEQLQELDLKIDSLKKKKADLPGAMKESEDAFQQVRRAVEAKQNAQAELEKSKRQTRAAIDLNNDRLARSTSRLEGVQNSQEYQAVSKEIDQLKKLNANLEEQIAKVDQDIAAIATELEGLTASLNQAREARDARSSQMSEEGSKIDQDIASLQAERTQYLDRVEKRLVSQYERIRPVRAGMGIVPAVGGRCKGCNMILPPQLYIQVQRGTEAHQCPSCFRLLFIAGS